jgi:K+-sensing histidine kinase KdpD
MNAVSAGAGQAMVRGKTAGSGSFSLIKRYGVALFSIAAALVVALFIHSLHGRATEVPLFMFAVAAAAWYGGIGPAVLALVVACLSFDYFFVEPLYTLGILPAEIPYSIAFAAFAVTVCLL